MRVLTNREREAFEAAWMFMERVGGMVESPGENERSVHNIVVVTKSGEKRPLPPKVAEMVGRLGGLRKTNDYFNGMTKERYFNRFVERLMSRMEQPLDYWSNGRLEYEESRDYCEIEYEIEEA